MKRALTESFERIWTKGAVIEAERNETRFRSSSETDDEIVDCLFIQYCR